MFSGAFLLIAYPTKALTNPLFYVKLGAIALAIALMPVIRKRMLGQASSTPESLPARGRRLAVISLLLWIAVIGAGRLLAYTYSRLMAYSLPTGF